MNYEQHIEKLDFAGIPFPVRVGDIPKFEFEKRNDISINVFGYEKREVYLLHLTRERGLKHVDLLVLNRGENSHYCWTKSINRLLNDGQIGNQLFYCHYCLHGFTNQRLL